MRKENELERGGETVRGSTIQSGNNASPGKLPKKLKSTLNKVSQKCYVFFVPKRLRLTGSAF